MNIVALENNIKNNVVYKYIDSIKNKIVKKIDDRKWADTKEILLKGVKSDRRDIIDALLDNQRMYDRQYHDINLKNRDYQDFMHKIVVQVFNNSLVFDLIGIQPMKGPVSLAYSMDWVNSDEGRKRLTVVSHTVEAGTRKLEASWSIEVSQDMSNNHGIDIEKELLLALSDEIIYEFNVEFIHNIIEASKKVEVKLKSTDLLSIIKDESKDIVVRSRRGYATWIIVSPAILGKIKKTEAEYLTFNDEHKGSGFLQRAITLILDDDIRVNVYCYNSLDENMIVMGYKGGTGETDTAMIWTPYIGLMTTGVVVDPNTFAPQINLMTRYGKYVSDNADDYYTTISLK